MKIRIRHTLIGIVLIAAACTQPVARGLCTDDLRYGLLVYVQDSMTGASIASGATLVAREGDFQDSFTMPAGSPDLDAQPLRSAGERAGTYQVSVSRPGYAPWTMTNVSVTAAGCHVIPTSLTARLQPAL